MSALSRHERRVIQELERSGCIVLRNGWPDFLVVEPEPFTPSVAGWQHGPIRAWGMEAKDAETGDHRSADQRAMHQALTRYTSLPVATNSSGLAARARLLGLSLGEAWRDYAGD